jgi:hypothetical protein
MGGFIIQALFREKPDRAFDYFEKIGIRVSQSTSVQIETGIIRIITARSRLCVILKFFPFLLSFSVLELFLLKEFPPGLHPFKKMPEFTPVEPDPVILTAIDDDAAFYPEIDTVHEFAADRAFDVGHTVVIGPHRAVDTIQLASIDGEYVGDRCLQERFQFPGIKEESQALIASFDQKSAVQLQIDGFQPDDAPRADTFRFAFMGRIVIDPFKIDIIPASAIITLYRVRRKGRRTVGAIGHVSSSVISLV